MTDLHSAIIVSLYVSIIATVLSASVGIPIGSIIAVSSFRGKRFVIIFLNTLLSLPTVVIGLIGYVMLCRRSVLGGLNLLFTPESIIIGEFVLALPVIIVFTHSAVASINPAASETAVFLGASKIRIMFMLFSEARFGIMAAVIASFGRLIGEVGVAMMLGGNINGYSRTMTTAIALEASRGEIVPGLKLGILLLSISVVINLLLRILQGRSS